MAYGAEISKEDSEVQGNFRLALSSVGNPDHGQDPGAELYGVTSKIVSVKTLKEASVACSDYISENELGGGNWSGGNVFLDGTLVARISYNGRIWRPGQSENNNVQERPRG